MNNKELSERFDRIDELDNSFDSIVALKQFNKDYKHSDFYKLTKMSVFKAYELYHKMDLITVINKVKNLVNPTKLSQFLQQTVDQLEPDTIQNFFDKIGEVFDVQALEPQKQELQELVNELKTLA